MKVESRSLISLECDIKEGTSGFGTPNQLDRPLEEVSTFCLLLELLLLPALLAGLLLIADQNKHAIHDATYRFLRGVLISVVQQQRPRSTSRLLRHNISCSPLARCALAYHRYPDSDV